MSGGPGGLSGWAETGAARRIRSCAVSPRRGAARAPRPGRPRRGSPTRDAGPRAAPAGPRTAGGPRAACRSPGRRPGRPAPGPGWAASPRAQSEIAGGSSAGSSARSASRWATGTRIGQPATPWKAGRMTALRSLPWASMSDVIVSASTQPCRAGQSSAASVPSTSPRARSMAFAIWAAGPPSTGAGVPRTAGEPASEAATAPSGSGARTTTGSAPPAQAASTRRRPLGCPSTSRSAASGLVARMQAATVTGAVPRCDRGRSVRS